jgi:hypothetical protein
VAARGENNLFAFYFFLDKKVAKNQGFRKIAKNAIFYRK